jgi:type II secretory pathway pseudopilin PulG
VKKLKHAARDAFSFIEILIIVAVIAVLSTLILSSFLGTSERASELVARQQQAELQTALGNWIARQASEPGGLAGARDAYNSTNNKLSLLTNYLQTSTLERLSGSGADINSDALSGSKAKLQLPANWDEGETPIVEWINSP